MASALTTADSRYSAGIVSSDRRDPEMRVRSMRYVKEEKTGVSSSKSRDSYSSKVLERGIICEL